MITISVNHIKTITNNLIYTFKMQQKLAIVI